MSTPDNQSIYNLIRSYMSDMGTSRTTAVALKSYMDAVGRLKCEAADFKPMLARLNTVIKNTEPRVIPLVHLVEAFEAEMTAGSDLPLEAAKQRAMDLLNRIRVQFQNDTARVTANCITCIAPGDLIIAHLLPPISAKPSCGPGRNWAIPSRSWWSNRISCGRANWWTI